MNNRMFSALLLLCLTLSGCAGIAAPTPSAVREVIVTSDEARVGPLLAHWEMGEETTIRVDEDALFSILGFQLTQSETLIFYSLVNLSAKTMIEEQLIGIHGGGGAFYSLIKVMPLLHDQNMELGILVFEPRHPGDSNLYLQMTSRFDNTRSDKLLAARFTGSPRQDRLESTYTFRNEAGVKVDDYQLELLLWSPFAGQLSSGPDQEGPSDQTQTVNPTSTAVGKTPMGETAVGVTVVGEYSFNIQNLPKGSTDIVVLQLLSDGTVFLLDGDEVRTPEIILVPTEVLPGAPYPSPVAP